MGAGIWYLKACRLLGRLSDAELRRLESSCRTRSFARGEPVYLPAEIADSVMLVIRGRVKICHLTPDGKQSILAFIEPGELFGELSVVDPGQPREEYAETVEPSEIAAISGAAIREIAEGNPGLSLGITRLIGLRRKRVEQRLKQLLFLSSKERLCHLLLELAERYGKRTADGIALGIRLSHQDLASVIGATRETVTVTLGELQGDGLLRTGRRRITLTDLDRLARLVDQKPPPVPSDLPG